MLHTPKSCAVALMSVLVLLVTVAPAQAEDWPDMKTVGVVDITSSTATFQATVDAHGLPTTARFEYGPTKDALMRTPDVAVGSAEGSVTFTAPVTGLVANRTYYVQVHAENELGEDWGDLVEFRTFRAPNLLLPSETDITQTSAVLHVKVMTYGAPVTVTTSTVGPDGVAIPSAPVEITADTVTAIPVSGLQPGTRYRWTSTGTSAGGQDARGSTFTTAPLVAVPRPVVTPSSTTYGQQVTLSGTLPNFPGVPITLQKQAAPFVAPFAAVPGATATSDAQGAYRFTFPATDSAKFGVAATNFVPPGPANTVSLRVSAGIEASLRRARRHRFVVSGRVWPGGEYRVRLHRRNHGPVGPAIRPAGRGGSATFRFPARKLKAGQYDVRLTVIGNPGLDPSRTAAFRVPKR